MVSPSFPCGRDIGDYGRHAVIDGVGDHWRQRRPRLELFAFDKISGDEPGEPTEAARQLDRFGEPQGMCGTR